MTVICTHQGSSKRKKMNGQVDEDDHEEDKQEEEEESAKKKEGTCSSLVCTKCKPRRKLAHTQAGTRAYL